MEEKKKIFIRGCKGRGDEVKKILTELGATPVTDIEYDNDYFVYFINHKNEISFAMVDSEVGALVMDNYKEIELPSQQWKDGNILINNNRPNCYAVFKKYFVNGTFDAYFTLENKTAYFDATESVEFYHLANAEEMRKAPMLFYILLNNLDAGRRCLPIRKI